MNYERCYAKNDKSELPTVHALNPIEGTTWCGKTAGKVLPYLRNVIWGTPDGDWCPRCATRHADHKPTPEEAAYLKSREAALGVMR